MALAPDEKYCKSCGTSVKKNAEWCPNCGVNNTATELSDDRTRIYCETCGEEIHVDTEICPACGVRQQSAAPTTIRDGYSGVDLPTLGDASQKIWYSFQWVVGVVFLLGSIGAFTDPETSIGTSILTGLLMAGLGLVAIPVVRERVRKEHPVTTFGRIKNVEEIAVKNPSKLCTACSSDLENGVRREYRSEFVIAGLVLHRTVDGINHYCRECLQIEGETLSSRGAAD